MAESPIFIAENMGALMALTTSIAGDSGYPKENMMDNLHYTSFKVSSASNVDSFLTPSGDPIVDCVVVDSLFADAAGSFRVYEYTSPSTFVEKGIISSISMGANFIPLTSFAIPTALMVRIFSTINPKIVRHLWAGIQLPCKNPLAPFDPEAVEQPMNQLFGRSGVMVKNSPIYTKKVLELNYENLDTSDYASLLALYNKAYLKGLPFWYFHRPTSQPTMGYLYEFEQDGFKMPFTLGNYRSCQIRAKANYSPDRSTATL